jgi:hypothetical protein
MSGCDLGVQFLGTERMTYWGKSYDASFWTENAPHLQSQIGNECFYFLGSAARISTA